MTTIDYQTQRELAQLTEESREAYYRRVIAEYANEIQAPTLAPDIDDFDNRPAPTPIPYVEYTEKNYYIVGQDGRPRLIRLMPHQKAILNYALDEANNFDTIVYSTSKKCMAETERLWLTDGTFVPAKTLLGKGEFEVFAFDEANNEFVAAPASASDNGMAECLRITTSNGRQIIRTKEHPLYTWNGWRDAGTLKVGDSIGFPDKVPTPIQTQYIDDDELRFVGYMIGDGSLGSHSTPTFSQNEGIVLDDMVRIGQKLGFTLNKAQEHKVDYRVVGTGLSLCYKYGLLGKISHEHRVPEVIFKCSDEQIAVFLSALIDTDGWCCITKNNSTGKVELGYSTISPGLVDDVCALFSRLGLYPRVKSKYADGRYTDTSYQLTFSSKEEILQLASVLKLRGKQDSLVAVAEFASHSIVNRSSKVNTLPKDGWDDVLVAQNRPWSLFRNGHPVKETWALTKEHALEYADAFESISLRQKATRPVVWDQIIDIENIGLQPTIAITVPGYENYLATEISHNSGKTAISATVAKWIAAQWGMLGEQFAVANDLEQSKGRMFKSVAQSIALDPRYDRLRRTLVGDDGQVEWRVLDKEIQHVPSGSIIRAIAADYKGEAGSNPQATFWSELWAYTSENSTRLWDELTPVPTRLRSLRFIDTYAGYENESELLWDLYEMAVKKGQRVDIPGWPFDDPSPTYVNKEAHLFAYWDEGVLSHRMPWQTPQYYEAQKASLRPAAYYRLHENLWTSSSEAFLPIEWWDHCHQPALTPITKNEPLVLAIDASVSHDSTAITGCTRHPQSKDDVALRFGIKFDPPPNGTINYDNTIRPTIKILTEQYNVVQVGYDPYQMHHLATEMTTEGLAWMRPFGQGAERLRADKQLFDIIRDRRIAHANDDAALLIRDAIQQANAKLSKDEDTRFRIVKKTKNSRIDPVVALSMNVAECLRLSL